MESPSTTIRVLLFVRKNWFQLALVLLGLYFFFRKDLSFQINVQSPEKTNRHYFQKPKEKITDGSFGEKDGPINRLEIPLIGGRKNDKDAFSELGEVEESERQAYLKRFSKVALAEQKKFDIPASVILATALHQSYAGARLLASEANNQFALPCSLGWQGPCADDQGHRYRRYSSAWESFRDFSLFAGEHFPDLKGKNYKVWAKGMENAGFGESEDFAKNLIGIIETYGLQKLDK